MAKNIITYYLQTPGNRTNKKHRIVVAGHSENVLKSICYIRFCTVAVNVLDYTYTSRISLRFATKTTCILS